MTETILDPEVCPACGSECTPPFDGQWRWARGGRRFESLEQAEMRAERLHKQSRNAYEYLGAVDAEGRARIATRRTA
jgi:hypothetical protein